jgi:Fic family protein
MTGSRSVLSVAAALSSRLNVLDARLRELRVRYPDGVESGVIGYPAWLRNELTYSSNAIEGNTLTDFETKLVLEEDAVIAGKTLREHNEAKGHAEAWDVATSRLVPKERLSADDILELHRRIAAHTLHPDSAGVLRRQPVRVAGAPVAFPNWVSVPERMERLGQRIGNSDPAIHPLVRAALAHLDLVSIHPFVDGNGRTARLLMNTMLVRAGYVAIPIYPADRPAYLAALQAAQVADGDQGAAFCEFAVTLELREIEQLLTGE